MSKVRSPITPYVVKNAGAPKVSDSLGAGKGAPTGNVPLRSPAGDYGVKK